MPYETSQFADIFQEMALPKRDMSDTIALIDICCMALEEHEPGLWWNGDRNRRRLWHPAVLAWMDRYGFGSFEHITADGLIAMSRSLQRRLETIERGRINAS